MSKHLVIAAAGTGGHVMPGVAVAKILISRGWTVSWIGTEQGMGAPHCRAPEDPFYGSGLSGAERQGPEDHALRWL